jgi:hypothetical protein
MRFYGMSFQEVNELELGVFNMLIECVQIIEAQEQLAKYNAHDWPNIKRQDRSSRHRKLHSIAYPKAWNQTKEMKGEDFAQLIKGIIGG